MDTVVRRGCHIARLLPEAEYPSERGRMPERLLSTLAHVDLLTTDLEKSVDFAREILGLDVVERVDDTVYLRCWGDYYLYSLALTASDGLGLGHAAWRAEGPEQLSKAVGRLEASRTDGA